MYEQIAIILLCISLLLVAACQSSEQYVLTGNVIKCLNDKGVKFYGSALCPHCAEQKQMLGDAFKQIDYIECYDAETQSSTKECDDAKIEGYPTWVINGKQELGVHTPAELKELAGC